MQVESEPIHWRIHLQSTPETVYAMLSTQEGRERFWAESAPEKDGVIHFRFPGGQEWQGEVREALPSKRFQVVYYGGSLTTFELHSDSSNGTDLELTDKGVHTQDRCEVLSGWVSVLLALKAAVDFGVDLRNHDPQRTWDQIYADN